MPSVTLAGGATLITQGRGGRERGKGREGSEGMREGREWKVGGRKAWDER